MDRLERVVWRDDRSAGVAYALAGIAAAASGGAVLGKAPGGAVLGAYTVVAARGLWAVAAAVEGALARGDLDEARRLVPALVGRDPSGLDESELARATVESVAENTCDAIVAPAFFAALWGPAGGLGYRAANTLDAMVGHRDDRHGRFGWASARLDDVANFLPARITAALVAAARPSATGAIWRAVRDDAPGHPSPNAGVVEAAFAAALGVRLGGTNRYGERQETRVGLGSPASPAPVPAHIGSAVRCSKHVTVLACCVLVVAAALAAAGSPDAR